MMTIQTNSCLARLAKKILLYKLIRFGFYLNSCSIKTWRLLARYMMQTLQTSLSKYVTFNCFNICECELFFTYISRDMVRLRYLQLVMSCIQKKKRNKVCRGLGIYKCSKACIEKEYLPPFLHPLLRATYVGIPAA